jgi:hypothetical protein
LFPVILQNNLGGGEGVEGLYGSITGMHMQRMLAIMREHCGLDASSHLVDIGAGLGRPLIHALVTEGISGATGIELDFIKCMKADAFLKQTAKSLLKRGLTVDYIDLPVIECKPVEKVRSLDPATHAYSFWEGVPVDARVAFGRLFAKSKTLKSVTVVQRNMRFENPEEVMEHGYCFGPVSLVETLSVSMSGSNRHFTAYVFNKTVEVPAIVVPRRRRTHHMARADGAPAADVVVVGTPPLSADNAAKLSSATDSEIDAVSKKLDLAEIASPVASGRGGGRGGRPRMKRKQVEVEGEVAVNRTTRLRQSPITSPKEKAKKAPVALPATISTRASPRKQPQRQQQSSILAASLPSLRVGRHQEQQEQQKLVVNKLAKQQKIAITLPAAVATKHSPNKSINCEARGLVGGGGRSVGLLGAAELLEGSNYPRTRHAVGILS